MVDERFTGPRASRPATEAEKETIESGKFQTVFGPGVGSSTPAEKGFTGPRASRPATSGEIEQIQRGELGTVDEPKETFQEAEERRQKEAFFKLRKVEREEEPSLRADEPREALLRLPFEERQKAVVREKIRELKESELLSERLFGKFQEILPEKAVISQLPFGGPETVGGPVPVSEERFEKFIKVTEKQQRAIEFVELIEGTAFLGAGVAGTAGRRIRKPTSQTIAEIRQPALEQFEQRRRTEEFVEGGKLVFERDVIETKLAPLRNKEQERMDKLLNSEIQRPLIETRTVTRKEKQLERELNLPKDFFEQVETRIRTGKEFSRTTERTQEEISHDRLTNSELRGTLFKEEVVKKGSRIAPLSLEDVVRLSTQKEPRLLPALEGEVQRQGALGQRAIEEDVLFLTLEGRPTKRKARTVEKRVKEIKISTGGTVVTKAISRREKIVAEQTESKRLTSAAIRQVGALRAIDVPITDMGVAIQEKERKRGVIKRREPLLETQRGFGVVGTGKQKPGMGLKIVSQQEQTTGIKVGVDKTIDLKLDVGVVLDVPSDAVPVPIDTITEKEKIPTGGAGLIKLERTKRKPAGGIPREKTFKVTFLDENRTKRVNQNRWKSKKQAKRFGAYITDVGPEIGFKVSESTDRAFEIDIIPEVVSFGKRKFKFKKDGDFFVEREKHRKDSFGERVVGDISIEGGAAFKIAPDKKVKLISKDFDIRIKGKGGLF